MWAGRIQVYGHRAGALAPNALLAEKLPGSLTGSAGHLFFDDGQARPIAENARWIEWVFVH